LLPAAVAAIVSGLCDQLGKAVGAAARTLTPSDYLAWEREELARMLNDLAGFADRYGASPDQDRNDALARETVTVAMITSIHAKNLARIVSWTSADAYTDILEGIRKKLISASGMAAATNTDRHNLADWLRDAAGQLNSWAIPPDLELCRTVPDQPSIHHQREQRYRTRLGPHPQPLV
jgi:hypothetical protein